MPRKVTYGIDRDDDDGYDVYDEYGYDYDEDYQYDDSGIGENAKISETKQESIGPGVWRCPICTFDNEEGMPCCDICGVFRNPLVKNSSNGNVHRVNGICKDSGASVMAKSLFMSLADRTEKGNKVYKPGDIQGFFHDTDKALSPQSHYKVDIAPFKFDIPSPDDLVSTGKLSSRIGSKAHSSKLSYSDVPSGARENNFELESSANSSNATSSFSKSSRERFEENNRSSMDDNDQKGLSGGLNDMSLNIKSGNLKNVGERAVKSFSEYKPERWMLHDQSQDRLNQLNLAIVGHVDSGKSTLSGRLLHLLGRVSQNEMRKNEKEAKLKGKGSFAYAWALDEGEEERERGITMTVGVAYFDSKTYHVVLLDSPGHKDFVPNMISGATQADAAILVIDASPGSFEVGLDNIGGQTREHAQLIRSFGVDQVIVAVNKMDAVDYSRDRFGIIKKQLGTFLRSCGFKDSSVSWVPLSAVENQNLVGSASDSRLLSWYHGPCLLDAIDSLQPPVREYSKPLLMPICDIKSQPQGQFSACGKLEAGALRSGVEVLIMPAGEMGKVRSLERDSQACKVARAGDNVAVSLQSIDANCVRAGGVLCHPDFPVAVATHLELKLLVLENTTPILIGSQLEFHVHHAKEAARVVKILSLLDPKTGKVTKKAPRCLLSRQSAVLEVITQEAVCVEEFSSSKALGRVFLRSSGRTIAVGVITRIIE